MSILIWAMVEIALRHFAVLVPDRFWGGIIGAVGSARRGDAVATSWKKPAAGSTLDA